MRGFSHKPSSTSVPSVHRRVHGRLGAHLDDLVMSVVWSEEKKHLHINVLEIMAVSRALFHFQAHLKEHSAVLMSDNTSVVVHVNKQGGMLSRSLQQLTRQVFLWAESQHVTLSARYIPGQRNVLANTVSHRNQVIRAEWSLYPWVASRVLDPWGEPCIDLSQHGTTPSFPCFALPY
ncbi:uncharacterized protein [Palaemon carinicauda]|uniref:uncharacterized protein n=1 Tax=Palaemon carinicauda TaxID=392227 RepID=UPI0035B63074